MSEFHDLTMNAITGEPLSFEQYKGQAMPGREPRQPVRPHGSVRRSAYIGDRRQGDGARVPV